MLSFSKINSKISSDHTRSVINFCKAIINPGFDDLGIDISLKNKAGESYEADTQIFVVVYGVSSTQNDVDPLLWDRIFYIENKKVVFEALIDMNNQTIRNLRDDSSDDSSAVTFARFQILNNRLNTQYYT